MSNFSEYQINSENLEALIFARSLCEPTMCVPNSGISGISFVYQILRRSILKISLSRNLKIQLSIVTEQNKTT